MASYQQKLMQQGQETQASCPRCNEETCLHVPTSGGSIIKRESMNNIHLGNGTKNGNRPNFHRSREWTWAPIPRTAPHPKSWLDNNSFNLHATSSRNSNEIAKWTGLVLTPERNTITKVEGSSMAKWQKVSPQNEVGYRCLGQDCSTQNPLMQHIVCWKSRNAYVHGATKEEQYWIHKHRVEAKVWTSTE